MVFCVRIFTRISEEPVTGKNMKKKKKTKNETMKYFETFVTSTDTSSQ